jgi:hypothetical protein
MRGRSHLLSARTAASWCSGRWIPFPKVSEDGRIVKFESYASNLVAGDNNGVPDVFQHDRVTGVTTRASVGMNGAQPNGTSFGPVAGPFARFWSLASNLVAGDTNDTWDIFISELAPDADGDGLPTTWELAWGLDPTSATGLNGAAGDADGDGLSNLAEYQAGTHPRGLEKRYLAEGATGSFFDTQIALLNPADREAIVQLRFARDGGSTIDLANLVAAHSRHTIDASSIPGLESASFSTTSIPIGSSSSIARCRGTAAATARMPRPRSRRHRAILRSVHPPGKPHGYANASTGVVSQGRHFY